MNRAHWIRLIFAVVAVLALAGGITVAFLPLARPAAGGTCGPGTSSEPAIFAFFDPVSIGASAEPSSSDVAAQQNWLAFVAECQASADSQILIAVVLVGFAALLVLSIPLVSRRLETAGPARTTVSPGPGWYTDPENSSRWRWWDGTRWGPPSSPV